MSTNVLLDPRFIPTGDPRTGPVGVAPQQDVRVTNAAATIDPNAPWSFFAQGGTIDASGQPVAAPSQLPIQTAAEAQQAAMGQVQTSPFAQATDPSGAAFRDSYAAQLLARGADMETLIAAGLFGANDRDIARMTAGQRAALERGFDDQVRAMQNARATQLAESQSGYDRTLSAIAEQRAALERGFDDQVRSMQNARTNQLAESQSGYDRTLGAIADQRAGLEQGFGRQIQAMQNARTNQLAEAQAGYDRTLGAIARARSGMDNVAERARETERGLIDPAGQYANQATRDAYDFQDRLFSDRAAYDEYLANSPIALIAQQASRDALNEQRGMAGATGQRFSGANQRAMSEIASRINLGNYLNYANTRSGLRGNFLATDLNNRAFTLGNQLQTERTAGDRLFGSAQMAGQAGIGAAQNLGAQNLGIMQTLAGRRLDAEAAGTNAMAIAGQANIQAAQNLGAQNLGIMQTLAGRRLDAEAARTNAMAIAGQANIQAAQNLGAQNLGIMQTLAGRRLDAEAARTNATVGLAGQRGQLNLANNQATAGLLGDITRTYTQGGLGAYGNFQNQQANVLNQYISGLGGLADQGYGALMGAVSGGANATSGAVNALGQGAANQANALMQGGQARANAQLASGNAWGTALGNAGTLAAWGLGQWGQRQPGL